MAERRTLKLTIKQREDLIWQRDHDFRPYVRERCAAILKVAEGQAAYEVARHGQLKERDPDTVYPWLKHYKRDGLEGILAHQHGGAHHTSTDQSEELLERLRQGPAAVKVDPAHDSRVAGGAQRLFLERRLASAPAS